MTDKDHPRGFDIAELAYQLWQEGRLAEAADRYAEAMPLLDQTHLTTAEFNGHFACVLAKLGRTDEARAQWERCLAIELGQDPEGQSSAVAVARYFLADHLLRSGDATAARQAIALALSVSGPIQAIAHLIEAESLLQLGRRDPAEEAAARAVEVCTDESHRERIRARVQDILRPK